MQRHPVDHAKEWHEEVVHLHEEARRGLAAHQPGNEPPKSAGAVEVKRPLDFQSADGECPIQRAAGVTPEMTQLAIDAVVEDLIRGHENYEPSAGFEQLPTIRQCKPVVLNVLDDVQREHSAEAAEKTGI